MEEFTDHIKGQSLSFLCGVLDTIADNIESATCEEQQILSVEKLRCVTQELFSRSIDSQESYLKHDYELSKRLLARIGV